MEMATDPEGSSLADGALVAPLRRQTGEQECITLNAILLSGIDQGWLLRLEFDQLVSDCAVIDAVLAAIADRDQAWPDQPDPWGHRLPAVPSDLGVDPAWVVLSQRCDLIRGYVLEPFVELARARRVTDKAQARAAQMNSNRLIAIASDDSGTFVADMRTRAWLPKYLLPSIESAHASIGEPVGHKRFRHRIGGRYHRDAVPDDLRNALAVPLSKAFRKGTRNRLLRHFSLLLGQRAGDKVLVLAIINPEASEEAALLDWEEAVAELRRISPEAHAMVDPDSQALAEVDLSVSDWLDSFKFDFDDLTYGAPASSEQLPPRT